MIPNFNLLSNNCQTERRKWLNTICYQQLNKHEKSITRSGDSNKILKWRKMQIMINSNIISSNKTKWAWGSSYDPTNTKWEQNFRSHWFISFLRYIIWKTLLLNSQNNKTCLSFSLLWRFLCGRKDGLGGGFREQISVLLEWWAGESCLSPEIRRQETVSLHQTVKCRLHNNKRITQMFYIQVYE